jgi:ADP-ribose pyrophosphatase YjhB (NUDIX family)
MPGDPRPAACRATNRLLSELAAEYGECELLHERVEAAPDERDAAADASVAVGGAGAWVRDPDDRVLLVETGDGWAEPARTRRHGEEPVECALRAVRECAGLDATVTGLERVHVRHLDDDTGRPPAPQPFVVLRARASGTPAADAAWHAELPDELLYEKLADCLSAADTGEE